jgi:acyl carrier protein
MDNIRTRIRQFIVDNFLFGDGKGLLDATALLNEGIVDSTGALGIVTFLEETYGISVEDEELLPENLGSVDNLVNYLHRKRGQNQEAA